MHNNVTVPRLPSATASLDTSVTFNGAAAVFTVESETLIKATVPTGANTGTVSVVTPSGTLNSNPQFAVTN